MSVLWAEAANALKKKDEKQLYAFVHGNKAQLEDVVALVEAKKRQCLDSRLRLGNTFILRDVLDRIATGLDRFKQVGDIAIQVNPVHAALPWAAVRFLLQIAVNDSQIFLSVAKGVEVVTRETSRCAAIEVSLRVNLPATDLRAKLRDSLVCFYKSVLTYLIKAASYYSTSTSKRVFESIYRPVPAIGKHLNDVQDSSAAVDRLVKDNIAELSVNTEQTTNSILSLLQSYDDTVLRARSAIEETGNKEKWQVHSAFLRWISYVPYRSIHEESAKELVPGTGYWLQQRPQYQEFVQSPKSSVLWLCGSPGWGKTKLMSVCIQSMLDSVEKSKENLALGFFYCSKQHSAFGSLDTTQVLRSLVRQCLSTSPDYLAQVQNEYLIRKRQAAENATNVSNLTENECLVHLSNVTRTKPLILMVDGLDEMNDVGFALSRTLNHFKGDYEYGVKLLFASRPSIYINQAANDVNIYDIKAEDSANDISKYLSFTLQSSIDSHKLLRGDVPESLQSQIIEQLSAGANGMFLWAKLQLIDLFDNRRFKTAQDVVDALSQPATSLTAKYDEMYEQFALYAPSATNILQSTLAWMLGAQRPLRAAERFFALKWDLGGRKVRQRLLCWYLPRVLICSTASVSKCKRNPRYLRATKSGFDSVIRQISKTQDAGNDSGSNTAMERLQTALQCRKSSTAKFWMSKITNINASGGHFGNALQAAAFGGDCHCVSLVLDSGANITLKGRYGPPLRTAALMGHQNVVALLLSRGAQDSAQETDSCALVAAVSKGYTSIARLLTGPEYFEKDSRQSYAASLEAACFNGHKEMCVLLLAWRDPQTFTVTEDTALKAAFSVCRLDIIMLFLIRFPALAAICMPRLIPRSKGEGPSLLYNPAHNSFNENKDDESSFEEDVDYEDPYEEDVNPASTENEGLSFRFYDTPPDAYQFDEKFSNLLGVSQGQVRWHCDNGDLMRLAARLGDVQAIQGLLSSGISSDGSEDHDTYWPKARPIEVAAAYGRTAAVEALFKHQKSLSRALVFATRFSRLNVIQTLLKGSQDIEVDLDNFESTWKDTHSGYHDICISRETSPSRESCNQSALSMAIEVENMAIFCHFLQYKAHSSRKKVNASLFRAASDDKIEYLCKMLNCELLWQDRKTKQEHIEEVSRHLDDSSSHKIESEDDEEQDDEKEQDNKEERDEYWRKYEKQRKLERCIYIPTPQRSSSLLPEKQAILGT